MRVIAGAAGGVRLAPVPEGTRPVSDRAREGLFSSLGERVVGAAVLDLYAGTGALGIEALSRGASHVWFVDHSARAVGVIQENLLRAGLGIGASVVRGHVQVALRDGGVGVGEGVDLAFVDPPYAIDPEELRAVLELLHIRLARDGLIVLTRPKRDHTDVIPVDLQVAKSLTYGDTLVHLIRKDPRARERGVPGDV
ncbi:MAG: RsmD family RNA methyltransferase [Actinomycetota bacterium]